MLQTNYNGNFTLEGVQRSQSGTYGCRVEDYDAADDAELSQTLELRVACESPGRTGRRALAQAASSPSTALPPNAWSLPWSRGALPPGSLPQHPPNSHIRQPDSPFQNTNLTFLCSRICHSSPVPSGESPGASPQPSRPTWPASPLADPSPHQSILITPKLLSQHPILLPSISDRSLGSQSSKKASQSICRLRPEALSLLLMRPFWG